MYPVVVPSFGTLDVGLPGGSLYDDDAMSLVKVGMPNLKPRRAMIHFPGVSGSFAQRGYLQYGQVTWRLCLRVRALSILNAIQASIEANMEGEGELVLSNGMRYGYAVLSEHRPADEYTIIRGGDLNGWLRREDTLVFDIMAR